MVPIGVSGHVIVSCTSLLVVAVGHGEPVANISIKLFSLVLFLFFVFVFVFVFCLFVFCLFVFCFVCLFVCFLFCAYVCVSKLDVNFLNLNLKSILLLFFFLFLFFLLYTYSAIPTHGKRLARPRKMQVSNSIIGTYTKQLMDICCYFLLGTRCPFLKLQSPSIYFVI